VWNARDPFVHGQGQADMSVCKGHEAGCVTNINAAVCGWIKSAAMNMPTHHNRACTHALQAVAALPGGARAHDCRTHDCLCR
jgi:hypothetical protein